MSALIQLKRHVTRLRGCTECPKMIGPVVVGNPVLSPVMLIGQAPGIKEGPMGRPFAWTAGKTLFGWFGQLGMSEDEFRNRVYMAAVCRCFPGKADSGSGARNGASQRTLASGARNGASQRTLASGDRVPSPDEVTACSRHLATEVAILKPRLVIPVGKLAIAQLDDEAEKLTDIVGTVSRSRIGTTTFDVIALPHPSGASTWHRTEPGKTLLGRALKLISEHEAWRSILPPQTTYDSAAHAP